MPQAIVHTIRDASRMPRSFLAGSKANWFEIAARRVPAMAVLSLRELGEDSCRSVAAPADHLSSASLGKCIAAVSASPSRNSALSNATRAEIE